MTFVGYRIKKGREMRAKLMLVACCTIVLTGCAQFEDCPGNLRGTALVTDSQRSGALMGPNSPYWIAPSGDAEQGANGHVTDGTRWCEYVYE